ncbi:MAG: peptidase MA family metallohydrolase [Anaerolineae bacterium]
MQRYRIIAFIGLFLWLIMAGRPLNAQDVITFEALSTVNHFPQDLTFTATAASSAGEIVDAQLVFHLRNEFSSESITRARIEFEPARTVDLSYVWDTSAGTIPGAAVVYYWQVTDSAGNQARSAEQVVRYEDTRYDWQILQNEDIAVWWHDRRASFGQDVFDIAAEAVAKQRELFQADLDFQMRIIIYNNFDEFAAWNGVVSEFIGGQAFADQGITAQIVSAYGSQKQWLNDVIPHEISHLYFAQVTFNRRSNPPTWLNEGVAQYNEFGNHQATLRKVERDAQDGDLIALSALEVGFGYFDESRTRLAYDEALSAVTYLVETYGDEGMAALLAAYRQGMVTSEAFPAALGVTPGEFETAWTVWLGLEEGEFVTNTPWPLPTFPPSPTPFVRGTAVATSSGQAVAATPQPTYTPIPKATAVAQLTSTPVNTAVPDNSGQFPFTENRAFLLAIAGCLLSLCCLTAVLLILAFIWWQRRQHDKTT